MKSGLFDSVFILKTFPSYSFVSFRNRIELRPKDLAEEAFSINLITKVFSDKVKITEQF